MSKHTDSAIVEYHEDGSKTITTVETVYPPTKAQQAAGWTALGLLCVAPVMPLVTIFALEKWEEKREARREKKRLKSVK